jgi:hypothetical protein
VWIRTGLKVGDRVIVGGIERVKDGAAVRLEGSPTKAGEEKKPTANEREVGCLSSSRKLRVRPTGDYSPLIYSDNRRLNWLLCNHCSLRYSRGHAAPS